MSRVSKKNSSILKNNRENDVKLRNWKYLQESNAQIDCKKIVNPFWKTMEIQDSNTRYHKILIISKIYFQYASTWRIFSRLKIEWCPNN